MGNLEVDRDVLVSPIGYVEFQYQYGIPYYSVNGFVVTFYSGIEEGTNNDGDQGIFWAGRPFINPVDTEFVAQGTGRRCAHQNTTYHATLWHGVVPTGVHSNDFALDHCWPFNPSDTTDDVNLDGHAALLNGIVAVADTPRFGGANLLATEVDIDTKFWANINFLPPPHPTVNDVEWITRQQIQWKWVVEGTKDAQSPIWNLTTQQTAEVSRSQYVPSAMMWSSVFLLY